MIMFSAMTFLKASVVNEKGQVFMDSAVVITVDSQLAAKQSVQSCFRYKQDVNVLSNGHSQEVSELPV